MESARGLVPPRRLVEAQPATAAGWLAELPARAERLLARFGLTLERLVEPGGRASVALLVRRADGERATLKLLAPGEPEPAALELAALRRWDGLGAVRVLDAAPEEGALLLERLHGETSLRSLPDAKATLEALSTLRRLWVAPGAGHPFPSVAERTAAGLGALRATADGEAGPLVARALEVRAELLAAPPEEVLLHGDFRQGAVLAADAERAPWLAVGPEPVVGERAFDLARLVRDRLHDLMASPGAPAIARRRVTRLAGTVEADPERLRGWALYRGVASGVRQLAVGRRADGEALLEFASWM
ncbi:aminoglycoside phosphotransferase family protein [Streptomyces sp. DSM 44915]|uniref:Aminoglycoside phosphotransferase family protein n=1 Tax=Streptomyces chisholmiae TaxID=3075540 RepID=A0ABU2JWB1_9ACTN|nr:aminoglycoside phosphotransferase family protein [Streptomyces sp. DSM 44915]MDT0269292.1 aminoglycoside phosphotransferase family protein [Streptomyces sp. DSM 44915]